MVGFYWCTPQEAIKTIITLLERIIIANAGRLNIVLDKGTSVSGGSVRRLVSGRFCLIICLAMTMAKF